MARIASAVVPMIQAAETLTEQARDVLQLHRKEVPRSFAGIMASLEAAVEALAQAVEQLEARRSCPDPAISGSDLVSRDPCLGIRPVQILLTPDPPKITRD